jgi:transposase
MDFVIGHPLPDNLSELKSLVLVLLGRLDALEAENKSLRAENAALRAANAGLLAENAALTLNQKRLESEVAALRHRLGLDSTNSHKPPSSDGLKKAPAFSKPSGQKAGGQEGHQGKTLSLVSTPDAVVVHVPFSCTCCGKSLAEAPLLHTVGRRQVVDLPPQQLVVTEHQLGVVTCCGQIQTGIFPPHVAARVQYGARVQTLSALLSVDYRMSYQKISNLFADLFGYRLNESTAYAINTALSSALIPVEEAIKTVLTASPAVHFDETGMRVAGKTQWFHTASTAQWTYLFCHPNRGKQALDSPQSVLPLFSNWAIHDCWRTYFTYTQCQHGVCGAHLLRELTALEDNDHSRRWATEMKKWLLALYKKSKKGTKVVPDRPKWEAEYEKICAAAARDEPLPLPKAPGQKGKVAQSKGRNLLKRLEDYQASVLAFAFVKEVPFTNNQAERDIRCVKIKQKVAMSFRTVEGAQVYARIQGFISSVRKNGLRVFQQILNVIQKEKLDWIMPA